MTISDTTNRVPYTGNGSTTSFAFPYPVHAAADLLVYVDGVLKSLTTDYTLSGSAPYTSGTNVQFLTAPANASSIVIIRDPALTQPVDLVENDPLPVETQLERPLDKLTLICQRLAERVTRALRQPETDLTDIGAMPAKATRASKLLSFDANGDPTVTDSLPGGTTLPLSVANGGTASATAAAARTALGVDSGWVKISEATPSGAATVDFTGLTGYRAYAILLQNVLPATDGVELWLRCSTDGGSSFDTGANYRHAFTGVVVGTGAVTSSSNSDTKIIVHTNNDNGAGNGLHALIKVLHVASGYLGAIWNYVGRNGTGPNTQVAFGGGQYVGSGTVNALRVMFSSGNIASGTIAIYGLRG